MVEVALPVAVRVPCAVSGQRLCCRSFFLLFFYFVHILRLVSLLNIMELTTKRVFKVNLTFFFQVALSQSCFSSGPFDYSIRIS